HRAGRRLQRCRHPGGIQAAHRGGNPVLTAFLQDGRLELDNSRAERSIKPFVIGRKNWLFANTPRGARASAMVYSIVEAAKENHVNPLTYLTYLFERLPSVDMDDAVLDSFPPWSDPLPDHCRVPART